MLITPLRFRFGDRALGTAVVLIVAGVGLCLVFQGWQSRVPFLDQTPPIDDAYKFITRGEIAQWGRANSLFSYSAPGSAWLHVPGVLLVSDPRLFEFVGGSILHLGTLFGILLLTRMFFSMRCALLSVALYGFSELGLNFAGFLWPHGHPFFYVWTLYFAVSWAARRDARYLIGAIVVCAAGMYVHLEIMPAVLVLPVVWFLYRPPIQLGPMLIAIAISGIIWLPYLRFEYSRAFSDIISQLNRKQNVPADYRKSWCDPSLVMKHYFKYTGEYTPGASSTSLFAAVESLRPGNLLPANLVTGLLGNFRRNLRLPGVADILFGLLTAGLFLLNKTAIGSTAQQRVSYGFRRLNLWRGGALLHPTAAVLIPLLLIPWALLLYSTKDAAMLRETRYWWLWPAQIIVLAALVTDVASRLNTPPLMIWIGQAAICAMILINPLVLERIESWNASGWSGSDSYEKQSVDYVAKLILSKNKNNAAIGYKTFFYDWMVWQHVLDRRMKVGMEFDLLFRFLHGISNTDSCAEGFSAADEFRIAQSRPTSTFKHPFNFLPGYEPDNYFDVPPDEHFTFVQRFGPYLVLKRN
jgi:hypothetical protein